MKHDSLINILRARFAGAVAKVADREPGEVDPVLRPAGDPKFGDYQCNVAMSLARALKSKPRDIAQRIVDAVDLEGVADPLEIAGPGFINIRLSDEFLSSYLGEIPAPPSGPEAQARGRLKRGEGTKGRRNEVCAPTAARAEARGSSRPKAAHELDRLGMPPVGRPRTVVIDYSSPNIAKQMHVGHLRSTVIGDAFARVLMFEGHKVVRQNHLGDWGTQFGRVILALWHICMARSRNDDTYIADGLQRLRKAKNDGDSAVHDVLKSIVDCHEQSLKEDLEKKWFEKFVDRLGFDSEDTRTVSFDELELAYQFVSLAEGLAAGRGFKTAKVYGQKELSRDLPYEEVSRHITFMLQKPADTDEMEREAWKYARSLTIEYCGRIYDRLNVLLNEKDVCGESFYNDRLAPAVAELSEKLKPGSQAAAGGGGRVELREDDGAQCVFFYDEKGEPRFKTRDGDELPMIIRKSDGAFLYATTDLAAIRYRIEELGGDRLIYVTDARQKLHFEMLFAVARAAGWAGDDVSLEHVTFGSVLGDNKKPLKTRDGKNVKLRELLDEAEARALELLEGRGQGTEGPRGQGEEPGATSFTDNEKTEIARRVGVAAVKYADLRSDRVSDYVFNWDRMLAMQGNTAPYMMYAYARIRSIYRKAAERFGEPDVYASNVNLALDDPAERALALRLSRLRETIDVVAADLDPHVLCAYLYDLASDFMRFYEACPVLKAPEETLRLSRMRLCDLTARALRLGLGLLGIETIERM